MKGIVVWIAIFICLFISSLFAADFEPTTLMLITGVSIVLFAATSLVKLPPALPKRWELPAMLAAGGLGGAMGGLTGLWSPPLVILLLALRLDKSEYVRAFGFLLVIGAILLLGGYVVNGLMTKELFLVSLIMVIPTLVGFAIGERIRLNMDTSRYQKALLVFFLLMGLNLIRKVWFG